MRVRLFVKHLLPLFFTLLILLPNEILGASSKGTDFWFAYPRGNNLVSSTDTANVSFIITGSPGATGNMSYPTASTTTTSSFTLDSDGYKQWTGSISGISDSFQTTGNDVVGSRYFHITATSAVSVQAYYESTAGASNPPIAYWQILPTDALGKEYFVLAYGNPSTASSTEGSEFVIVATVNGTTVTINPTADVNTRPSGTAYQITLDQGQTYRAATGVANADYSGTLITATQPIAVMAGHTCAKIPTSTSVCSTVLEELFPTTGWSRNFILSPFAATPPGTSGDRVRMVANSNGTVININSTTTVNLDRGGLYETNLTGTSGNPDPTIITSNFPILVAQYSKDSTDYASAAASNRSEPSMLLVPGYDHYLTSATFNLPISGFTDYVNLVTPTSQVGTMTLDGSVISSGSFSAVGSTGYSRAILQVSPTGGTVSGNHTITAGLPFGVMSYGFGNVTGAQKGFGSVPAFNMPSIPQASSVTLSPGSAKYLLNTRACYTATLSSSNGSPVTNASVTFVVTGVNPATTNLSTDASGMATQCKTGTTLGTDTLIAKASASGTESSPVSIQWIQVASIGLTPSAASQSTINGTLCAKATPIDNNGNPIVGTSVTFSVTGSNVQSGSVVTDSLGTAEYCYTGQTPGQDTLAANIGTVVSPSILFDWIYPVSAITLSSGTTETKVGQKVCVSATGLDANGKGVANASIQFAVTGANSLSSTALTNASGIADYCYLPENAGTDRIAASSGSVTTQVPVTVTVANNPACDVVTAAEKNTLTQQVIGTCLSSFAQTANTTQFDACESAAKASFVSTVQASNTAAGCLASGGTVSKADQLLALINPVLNPILGDEAGAIQTFGKARATRRFMSIATQTNKFMDLCLNDRGRLNQSKADSIFDSLFTLSGKAVINTSPSAFVNQFKTSCSAIFAF